MTRISSVVAIALAIGAGNAMSQTAAPFNPGIQLQDNSSNRITLRSPIGGITSNYSLQFPASGPGSGALLFTNGTGGNFNWLSAGNDGYMLTLTSGLPTWADPATLLSNNFVRYNTGTTQATAAAGNLLFDVGYGALGAGIPALGSRIISTGGTNASASGLAVTATADGAGTATGISVSAIGGTNNYAAIFPEGNVGVGTSTPSSPLHVVDTTAPSATGVNTSVLRSVSFFNPSVSLIGSDQQVALAGRLRMGNTAVSNSTNLFGGLIGASLEPSATANATRMVGTNSFVVNDNATRVITQAIGSLGRVQNNAAGSITDANSFEADVQINGGSITNYRGLHLTNPFISSGSVTNAYGLDIEPITSGSTSNTAFRYNHATSPVVISGNGFVGIGTPTPTAKLDVQQIFSGLTDNTTMVNEQAEFGSAATTSGGFIYGHLNRLNINNTVPLTTNFIAALDAGTRIRSTATGTISRMNGIRGFVNNENSTQTLGHGVAMEGYILNAGSATNASSFYATLLAQSGSLTNYYGLQVNNPLLAAGTVSNVYGINIDPLTTGTVSNTAFRYNHATSPVVIGGNGFVGIGTSNLTNLMTVRSSYAPAVSADYIGSSWATTFSPSAPYSHQINTAEFLLNVSNSAPLSSTLNVNNAVDGGAVYTAAATATANELTGVRGWVRSANATIPLTEGVGVTGHVQNDGLMTNGTALRAIGDGTGLLTNWRGLHVVNYRASATNAVGIDIEAQTAGTASNLAFRYNHPTVPVVIEGDGDVGIGTATPGHRTHIVENVSTGVGNRTLGVEQLYAPTAAAAPSENASLRGRTTVTNTANITGGFIDGVQGSVLMAAGATNNIAGSLRAVVGSTNIQSTSAVTVNETRSVTGYFSTTPTSPVDVTSAVSYWATADHFGTGKVDSWRGLYVTPVGGTGEVKNVYGIDIADLNRTGASTFAFRYNYTPAPVVIQGNGNVGIGTSAPGSRLSVQQTLTASIDNQALQSSLFNIGPTATTATNGYVTGHLLRMYISNTVPLASNAIGGIDAGPELQPNATAGIGSMYGIRGYSNNTSATQTVTNSTGVRGHVQNNGLTTNAYAFSTTGINTGGTMTNYYGLHVGNPSINAGAITNIYGVNIEPISGGTTTNLAFRYNHATSPVVIGSNGFVGIGTSNLTNLMTVRASFAPAVSSDYIGSSWYTAFTPSAPYNNQINGAEFLLDVNNSAAVSSTLSVNNSVDVGAIYNGAATASVSQLTSIRGWVASNNTTIPLGEAIGVSGYVQNNALITNGTSLKAFGRGGAGTAITTWRGLHVETYADGPVTNNVAIDIDEQTSATAVNLAFRYNHATLPVVINGAGRVGIGSATPGTRLDVEGGVTMRPATAVNIGVAQNIAFGDRSYIRVTPTGGAALAVGLAAGTSPGHVLVVEILDNGANTLNFVDAAAQNLELAGNFNPANQAMLVVVWNGTRWVELSRSTVN